MCNVRRTLLPKEPSPLGWPRASASILLVRVDRIELEVATLPLSVICPLLRFYRPPPYSSIGWLTTKGKWAGGFVPGEAYE